MIRISVCMIVKNEEKVLARCLDSLAGLYEELIIVDTGSTDRTKEIAANYTDKIYDYTWTGDFSEARNFSFSKATQEYIYAPDADEVLDEVNRQRFLQLKEQLLPEIEIVQMWYVNPEENVTTENYKREYRPKLYRRLREFRWIEPVHETVNLNPVVYDSDVEILHLPEGNHGKRDFSIFVRESQQGKAMSPRLQNMYVRELMMTGDLEDFQAAAPYFHRMAEHMEQDEEAKSLCYLILAHYYRLRGDVNSFFKWSLRQLCAVPSAELCLELGHHYQAIADYQEAIHWYLCALNDAPALVLAAAQEDIPKRNLVTCYEALAALDEYLGDYYLELAEEYRC